LKCRLDLIAVEPANPALDFADPLTHLLHKLRPTRGELPIDALDLEWIGDGGSIVDESLSLTARQITSLSVRLLPKPLAFRQPAS
jgi:hypothetical protein